MCRVQSLVLLEKREVDAAVAAVLHKARMLGEIVALSVLQNEKAIFLEQITVQNNVGQLWYLRQDVWGIGKDEVELLAALCHELEGIAANGHSRFVLQLVEELLDEAMVTGIELYADDTPAATTDKFQCDAARSGEKVEGRRCLTEINIPLQDIEKVLLSKVRRRTRLEGTRHLEMPPFVFASDDTHFFENEE